MYLNESMVRVRYVQLSASTHFALRNPMSKQPKLKTREETGQDPSASLLREAQILLRRHDAKRVGMAFAAAPALNADDVVAFDQDAQLDGLGDTPLEAAVDVFLPVGLLEVGLLLGEEEGVDATVEVRVLSVD